MDVSLRRSLCGAAGADRDRGSQAPQALARILEAAIVGLIAAGWDARMVEAVRAAK